MNRTTTRLFLAALTAAVSQAATVGYFTDNGTPGVHAATLSAAGHTPVEITDIATFNFATVQVVMINESSNGGYSSALTGRLGDLQGYVGAGGVLVLHDRFVGSPELTSVPNAFLFGQPGIRVQRNFGLDTEINLTPAGQAAFPTLTDASLDGGDSSSHGFADGTTLPGDATSFLFRDTQPNQVVAFGYGFGDGALYYSTVPLDYYLNGDGPTEVRPAFLQMGGDSVNAALSLLTTVPEPSEYAAMAGAGLLAFAFWRRTRGA